MAAPSFTFVALISLPPATLHHDAVPFIDLRNGGRVQGEIKSLNHILDRTGYEHEEQGGTYIIPGHGYLSDEHQLAEDRDMVLCGIVEAMIKCWRHSGTHQSS